MLLSRNPYQPRNQQIQLVSFQLKNPNKTKIGQKSIRLVDNSYTSTSSNLEQINAALFQQSEVPSQRSNVDQIKGYGYHSNEVSQERKHKMTLYQQLTPLNQQKPKEDKSFVLDILSNNDRFSRWSRKQTTSLKPTVSKKINQHNISMPLNGRVNSDLSALSNRLLSSNEQPFKFKKQEREKRLIAQKEGSTKFYMLGHEEFKISNFENANRYFCESVTIDPYFVPSRYMMGICFFSLGMYEKSIRELQIVVDIAPKYQKNMYLIMALCYKKQNLLNQGIKILELGMKEYLSFYDAFIFKGKLEMKLKNYSDASQTFQKAVSEFPKRSQAYSCSGDIQKIQGNSRKAIQLYTKAVQIGIFDDPIQMRVNQDLLKLAVTLYEDKQYELAEQRIDELISRETLNSEAFNLKGLIQLKRSKIDESVLSFEQAIKNNNSKSAVTKSLLEIAKIKIEKRNFYSAFHTLSRAEFLDVDSTQLNVYLLFTEVSIIYFIYQFKGIIHMMKRKFDESKRLFDQLVYENLPQVIQDLFNAYRGYCYFSISLYEEALIDFNQALKNITNQSVDRSSLHYNKLLCEGILAINSKEYKKAVQFFDRSLLVDLNEGKKAEPELYKCIVFVQQSLEAEKENDFDLTQTYISKSISAVTLAHSISPHQAIPLYLRSIINGYTGEYPSALTDIEQAIEKSDENLASHFYLKGVLLACYGDIKAAVAEFGVVLGLDDNYADVYLQRSKCNYLLGESTLAFEDMEKYVQIKPKDSDQADLPEKNINLWAGNLLLCNKAYEDALKAFNQGEVTLDNFNQLLKQQKLSNSSIVLQSKVKCHLGLKKFNDCRIELTQLKASYENPQIAQNIQFEIECLYYFQNIIQIPPNKDEQLSFDEISQSLTKLISGKQNGFLFKQSNLMIYRGVCLFHSQKYDMAMKDFERALSTEEQSFKQQKQNLLEDIEELGEKLEPEESEELIHFRLECQYNIMLCWIMLKKYKYAQKQHESILAICNQTQKPRLQPVKGILENEIQHQNTTFMVQNVYQTNEQIGGKKEDLAFTVTLKKLKNELCHRISPIIVQSPTLKDKLNLYLSFDIPFISMPDMSPVFDVSLIRTLSPAAVENRPEAPWIKRNVDGVMFSDNIQIVEGLRLDTEEQENTKMSQENFHANNQSEDNYNTKEEFPPPNHQDRDKFKQQLQLNSSIEEKLKVLINKQKKT